MAVVSYLFYYECSKKCESDFITKCDKSLLQNVSAFFLQNATVITKCDDFVTKCDSYYKMRRLLQNASINS